MSSEMAVLRCQLLVNCLRIFLEFFKILYAFGHGFRKENRD